MAIRLYDLAAADPDRRFSPFCWRTKFALAHKGLLAETIPWRFTDKDAIASSGQGRVPVLVDGDRVISDSWAIALYLEEAYPDRPSLFGGSAGIAPTRFINMWADTAFSPQITPLIVLDIFRHLHEKDRAYFRETRETRFGMTLEAVAADRDQRVLALRDVVQPLRTLLRSQPFVGGEEPRYSDYIVMGPFQWARCVSSFQLLAADDPVAHWRERMLSLFDGMARKAPGYPV